MDAAAFEAKIKKVAEILGYEAEVKDGCWCNLAEFRKGREDITLGNEEDRTGRIEIWGSYPRYSTGDWVYGTENHKITVAETKTPEQIARDMERRFLPGYRTELAEVVEKVQRYDAKVNQETALIQKAAELVNGRIHASNEKALNRGTVHFPDGELELRGGYSNIPVSFSLKLGNLSYAQLEAVVNALKQ